jgi:AcrR family transcriptional regulator
MNKSAKTRLIEAMEALLQNKCLDDISVSEIIAAAGVCRKTFYRNFQDKYALAAAYFEIFFDQSLGAVFAGESFDEALLRYLEICESRARIFTHAYSSRDVNGLRSLDVNYTRRTYQKYLLAQGADIEEPTMRFAIEIAVRGGMEMVIGWLTEGMPISKEQLRDLIKRTLPGDLLRYL